MKKFAILSVMALAGCNGMTPPTTPVVDPTITAKVQYVCLYSGLFKAANSLATGFIPGAGGLIGTAGNAAIDNACLHPETVSADIGAVDSLIGSFKNMGRM